MSIRKFFVFFKNLWDNQKIELAIFVMTIICGVVISQNQKFYCFFKENILMVFDSTRLGFIISAAAIILGIYIAVISILATSVLGITKKMLEKHKDKQLLQITFSGMIVNAALVFVCVLININTVWKTLLIIALLLIVIVSFFKFLHLIFLIFQANLEQIAASITDEELEKEELFTLLKKIEQKVSNKKDSS